MAEKAKRRLIAELYELKLPIVGRDEDPDYGLAFDLLSSEHEKVFTGHDNGVITLDLAEGDDVHREQLRIAMDEPYRTLLGHFRHEIGHYYYYRLVEHVAGLHGSGSANCSAIPTPTTRRRWTGTTSEGAPAGWEKNYVSSYATMHPAEDWAETFAHYLHIRDTLDTAAAFSFAPAARDVRAKSAGPERIRHDHRHVAAAVVVAEHDQPVDGQARTSTRSCCRRRCWRRCGSSTPSSTRSPRSRPNSLPNLRERPCLHVDTLMNAYNAVARAG